MRDGHKYPSETASPPRLALFHRASARAVCDSLLLYKRFDVVCMEHTRVACIIAARICKRVLMVLKYLSNCAYMTVQYMDYLLAHA